VRGCGYFRVVEIVKDRDTRETFDDAECEWLLRGELTPRLLDAGLFCRADDRADPVVVLAPPLVCGEAELTFIGDTLRRVLGDVWEEYQRR
jgi:adenosylmethionine-8-amino-7-oxononanoate aminotransferase